MHLCSSATLTNVKGSDYVNKIANYYFSDSRLIVYGAVSGKTDETSCFSSVFMCILNIERCSLKKKNKTKPNPKNNLALGSCMVAHLCKDEAQEWNVGRGEKPSLCRDTLNRRLKCFYIMENLNNLY